MAQFDSHKWTREFKEAQVAQASREVDQDGLGEDYSTMRLKSDIDQKWKSSKDMQNDLRQWFEATYQAGGYDLVDDIVSALEVELKLYTKYRADMRRQIQLGKLRDADARHGG